MATTTIMQMPVATAIDGSEYFPLVQAGTNRRAATGLVIQAGQSGSVQSPNTVFAGPAVGPDPAAPTFRALVAADFSAAIWSVSQGGTGLSSLAEYALLVGGTTPTGDAQQVSGVGTAGQVLVSSGAGALPTWQDSTGVTGQALTKTDDTNVTLALGGTPATALLQAVSLTLGWTGLLAVNRGGTGVSTLGTISKTDDTNVTLTLGGTPANSTIQSVSFTLGWTGVLAANRGGTGVSSLGTISKVDDTNVTLTLGGTPTNSTIQSVSFTMGWTGILAVARGGTGVATLGDITRTDDTNVTLTLGGTPTGATIQSVSFTLGWTGQLSVPRGGTGLASATAYAVLCGGTTSTGAFQSVASVGTSGQVLVSNGAGQLPTFQTIAGTGDVVGPGSATDNAITRFDNTTGKLIQNSSAILDDNGVISTANLAPGYSTTATAAGTTTLTVASNRFQYFTGSTTQTVTLPVTSTLYTGLTYTITNNSTGVVTVQSSGANDVLVMGPQSTADFICILTSGTDASSWSVRSVYANIPQNSQSTAYTTVLSDVGKHIFHPVGDNNARTFTIDSNANVPYPIGTAITFINKINTVTISIMSDTLTFSPSGATGNRALAANGIATAVKITSTEWLISGTGLT